MKYHHLLLLCSAFISIFCTKAAYSDVKVNIRTRQDPEPVIIHYSPTRSVELDCSYTSDDGDGTISWEKNGKNISELTDLTNRVDTKSEPKTTSITLKDLKESDVGNYSCVVSIAGVKYTDTIELATASSSKWGVRVTRNTNVVEEETLTLKCEVRGDLSLSWTYKNTTSGGNETSITKNDTRITLLSYFDEDRRVNVTNGELQIKDITKDFRGEYTCYGESVDGQVFKMTSTVRIKDKYAALWPFLGICAEVFILCAIIFIYEKKRNKTELEESDTDQSPDQKNTPDHGKDSNLRHRQ